MNVLDLTECSLCNEQYNDSNRRARNLSCGHYHCQECLNKIIKSATPHCPSCRADISVSSVEALPPNFLMDDLIRKMKSGTVLVDSKAKVEEQGEDFSAGDCPKHKKCQLYFTCKSHKIKICRDCTVLDHNPSRCEIISFENEIKETKASAISNLKTHKSRRENNIKDLQDIITEKEATIQKYQEEIEKSKQIINKANVGIRDCTENKTRIESVQRELGSSMTINKINQSCTEAENVIRASNSLEKSMETNFNITGFQDLIDQDPKAIVKKVLQSKATVHATAEVNGEKRFAQLIVKNGDVLLPALASCSRSPASNNTVTVSSLLTQYSNANIYVTLASDGKELGTVYVKLRDSDYAKYTQKLCMGTIGPCYRGAKFDRKDAKYFGTGNVSQYDTSKCTEAVPREIRRETFMKGMVCIYPETGLSFVVSNASSHSLSPVGDVINGISVIEEAHTYPLGHVSITDAGIVLK